MTTEATTGSTPPSLEKLSIDDKPNAVTNDGMPNGIDTSFGRTQSPNDPDSSRLQAPQLQVETTNPTLLHYMLVSSIRL